MSVKLKKETIILVLILTAGILVRVLNFGFMPAGINQDEAFAGYEAFSMLNYGTDSWGFKNPVYFVSWGSGMNVLSSYLMIPFIKLFGNTAFAARMPQLIAGLVAILVFYLILKETLGKRCALSGAFILAISPWHIMVSRWALESNMAPHMWLFAFYFFIKGLKNNRFLPVSMFFWGLSLYAYATMWFFVPLSLGIMFVYGFLKKQIKCTKMIVLSAMILFLLALPLMLFVLVNLGIIGEIKTAFISVPKLLYMRSGEMSLYNIFYPESYKNLFNILIKQNDGNVWNSSGFGTYYHLGLPFIVIGMFKVLKEKNIFGKMVLINIGVAIFISVLMWGANINRVNFIHFPMLMLLTIGLEHVAVLGFKKLFAVIIAMFTLCFGMFSADYFTAYQNDVSYHFDAGIEKALAVELDGEIYIDSEIYFPKILFLTGADTEEYRKTIKFTNYPSAYLSAESFGKYHFTSDFENLNEGTYIVRGDKAMYFKGTDFKKEKYDNIIVFKK